jgi:alkylhydroperoxidase family enzyme
MKREEAGGRQQQILADGPRIEPLKPDEMDEHALVLNHQIREMANRDLVERTLENLPQIVPTMLRHAGLFEVWTATGLHLSLHGAISPRERELAVLRIGWLCGAPYEFGEHVFIAYGAGIAAEEIDAVKTGSSDPCWSPHERAILAAVEELHSGAMISDATWDMLSQSWDEKQLIELPVLVGHYQQTAYVQNAIRLRLHPGNEGLLAE